VVKLIPAPKLVTELPKADYIIPDKSYDSKELRTQIRDQYAMPLIPKKIIQTLVVRILIGVSINICILLKTFLQGSNISELLPHDMIN